MPAISATAENVGNGNATIDGTPTNIATGALTAYLTNAAGTVIASSPVAANGTYSFANVANGTYNVVLSSTAGVVAGSPAPAASLPTGWNNTGEGLGTTPDGTANGTTPVTVAGASITNVNFGIQQAPLAQNNTAPNAQMSERLPAGLPRACSGLM